MVVKVYRRHRCGSTHRTAATFIRCAIRRLEWVHGSGEYALIAWCKAPTVTLFASVSDAERQKEVIDQLACGGSCKRHHEIVAIDMTRQCDGRN
ncbi:hypothetical protein GCM10027568_11050 [Humibacter soli]